MATTPVNPGLLLFYIIIILFAIGFGISIWRRRKLLASVAEAWKSLADQLGLNFELLRNMPKVSGKYRDHRMILDTYSVARGAAGPRGGRSTVSYTRLIVELNKPAKDTMVIYPGGYLARKVTRGQNIQLGDSLFDKKFVVRGSNELVVREVLDSSIRQQLDNNRSETKHFTVEIEGSEAYYDEPKLIADSARLRQVLDFVTELSIRFENQVG
jgi:hypothetical protein